MSEKVVQIKIPEGSKYRRVEVTGDGSILNIVLLEAKDSTIKVAKKPVEGKWFEVDPLLIDQKLFEKERKDSQQEDTRKLIQEAFAEVKKYPEKYGKPFMTMMPELLGTYMFGRGLIEHAELLGDRMADWVHQSLEWAQRLNNGESWQAVCNEADTANWYRLVKWKHGYLRLVGGNTHSGDACKPACSVSTDAHYSSDYIIDTVPLVVLYKRSTHCY